jgi:membrane-associated phospholipid phosphatase
MTAQQYERLSAPFRTPGRTKALNVVNKVLTRTCYVAYPLLLAALAVRQDGRLGRAVLVPALSFVLLSIFRHVVNAPRPYELLDIQQLIHKDKPGYSFPSRHVFSCFIIAMTFLWLLPWVGGLLLCFGVALALCRVIGGVHFPRDVIVGAAVGVLAGILGYWVF